MRPRPLRLVVLLILTLVVSGMGVQAHTMAQAPDTHQAHAACEGGACDPGHRHGPEHHGEAAGLSCASAVGHCAGAASVPATLPIHAGLAGSPFARPADHHKRTGPLPDTDTPPPRI